MYIVIFVYETFDVSIRLVRPWHSGSHRVRLLQLWSLPLPIDPLQLGEKHGQIAEALRQGCFSQSKEHLTGRARLLNTDLLGVVNFNTDLLL